jgi:hypothetical protein
MHTSWQCALVVRAYICVCDAWYIRSSIRTNEQCSTLPQHILRAADPAHSGKWAELKYKKALLPDFPSGGAPLERLLASSQLAVITSDLQICTIQSVCGGVWAGVRVCVRRIAGAHAVSRQLAEWMVHNDKQLVEYQGEDTSLGIWCALTSVTLLCTYRGTAVRIDSYQWYTKFCRCLCLYGHAG